MDKCGPSSRMKIFLQPVADGISFCYINTLVVSSVNLKDALCWGVLQTFVEEILILFKNLVRITQIFY